MGFFAIFDRCNDHATKRIRGVNDLVMSQINSYMYHYPFAVRIKYEISSLTFFIRYILKTIHFRYLAGFPLIFVFAVLVSVRIARPKIHTRAVTCLHHKAGTVDSLSGFCGLTIYEWIPQIFIGGLYHSVHVVGACAVFAGQHRGGVVVISVSRDFISDLHILRGVLVFPTLGRLGAAGLYTDNHKDDQ